MQRAARASLVEERKRRHWSQQEVAERLGTTRHNVSRWEAGQTTPGPYFRAKLSHLYGKTAEALGLFAQDPSSPDAPAPAGSEAPDSAQAASGDASSRGIWNVPFPRN